MKIFIYQCHHRVYAQVECFCVHSIDLEGARVLWDLLISVFETMVRLVRRVQRLGLVEYVFHNFMHELDTVHD